MSSEPPKFRKVVFFVPRLHNNLAGWASALEDNGLEPVFLVADPSRDENSGTFRTIQIRPSLSSRLEFSLRRLRGLRNPSIFTEDIARAAYRPSIVNLIRFLLLEKPDVLIARDRTRASFIAMFAANLTGVKNKLFYLQDPCLPPPAINLNQNLTLRAPHQIFRNLILKFTGLEAIEAFSPVPGLGLQQVINRRDVVPAFVPFAVHQGPKRSPESYMPNGTLRIVVVAKYRDYKNLDYVVEGLSQLSRKQRERVSVVVSGEVRTLSEAAMMRSLRGKLSALKGLTSALFDNLRQFEIREIFLKSDLIVLPSKTDLAPIAPLEAMAFGLVPIVSTSAGTKNYIIPGGTGFLINPNDPSGFREIVVRLLDKRSELLKIATRAQRFAREFLMGKELVEYIFSVADEKFEVD